MLTANIMKVGALLDDTRALIEKWDASLTDDENVARIVEENLLGLPSQSRAKDVIVRALRPRFIAPNAGILGALARLRATPDGFTDACYYELTRVDEFVARFVEQQVTGWWDEGRVAIETADARAWIDTLAADGLIPDWSSNIRDRVARGMMAALRDFGRLAGPKGSPKKQITRPGISLAGFAYAAYRLHQQGVSSRGILTSHVWRRWLLDEPRVEELLDGLSSRGVIFYSVAGSTRRIDWRAGSLAEVAHAAA